MSPLSMAVTLRMLRLGKHMSIRSCFIMEYRLSQQFMRDADFFEGVSTKLIRKSKDPVWTPARLDDVTPALLDTYFPSASAGDDADTPDAVKMSRAMHHKDFNDYPHVHTALPREAYLRRALSMAAYPTLEAFVSEMERLWHYKLGVREWVLDVASRHIVTPTEASGRTRADGFHQQQAGLTWVETKQDTASL